MSRLCYCLIFYPVRNSHLDLLLFKGPLSTFVVFFVILVVITAAAAHGDAEVCYPRKCAMFLYKRINRALERSLFVVWTPLGISPTCFFHCNLSFIPFPFSSVQAPTHFFEGDIFFSDTSSHICEMLGPSIGGLVGMDPCSWEFH